jgi:MoxR-like ATPase
MASGYRPRIADAELRACLAAAGAVVIEGPKACGKTRLAQQLTSSLFPASEAQFFLHCLLRHGLPGYRPRIADAERHTGAGRFSL